MTWLPWFKTTNPGTSEELWFSHRVEGPGKFSVRCVLVLYDGQILLRTPGDDYHLDQEDRAPWTEQYLTEREWEAIKMEDLL